MRKLLILLLCLMAISSSAVIRSGRGYRRPPSGAPAVPTPDHMWLWEAPVDLTPDSSPEGNDAAPIGSPTHSTNYAANASPGSFKLDGTNDYFQTQSVLALDATESRTTAIWLKSDIEDYTANAELFTTDIRWRMIIHSPDETLKWWNGVAAVYSTGVPVSTSSWQHFVVTYSNGPTDALRLYVDGVLRLTQTATYNNTADNTAIGSTPFNGKLDDAMVFKGMLTSNQVYALYTGTHPTNVSVLELEFEDPIATNAVDSIGDWHLSKDSGGGAPTYDNGNGWFYSGGGFYRDFATTNKHLGTNFTFAFWANYLSLAGIVHYSYGMSDDTTPASGNFVDSLRTGGSFDGGVDSPPNSLTFTADALNNSFAADEDSFAATLTNTWLYITTVVDSSGNNALYINGVAINITFDNVTDTRPFAYFRIGTRGDNTSPMSGNIAETYAWVGTALSPSEVAEDFANKESDHLVVIPERTQWIQFTEHPFHAHESIATNDLLSDDAVWNNTAATWATPGSAYLTSGTQLTSWENDPTQGTNGWTVAFSMKSDTNNPGVNAYMRLDGSGSRTERRFYLQSTDNTIRFLNGQTSYNSGEVVTTNWMNVVWTLTGSNGVLTSYIDGIQASQHSPVPLNTSASSVQFGIFGWSGSLDDMLEYDRALSSNEVYDISQGTYTSTGLVMAVYMTNQWPTNVVDTMGNQHMVYVPGSPPPWMKGGYMYVFGSRGMEAEWDSTDFHFGTNFTYSLWINQQTRDVLSAYVYSQASAVPGSGSSIDLAVKVTGNADSGGHFSSNSATVYAQVSTEFAKTAANTWSIDLTNDWINLVVTYNDSSKAVGIWTNGVQMTVVSDNISANSAFVFQTLGLRSDRLLGENAYIDDFGAWSQILTDAEIGQLYLEDRQ